MSKQFRFTFVYDRHEQSVLTTLAGRLNRSRSDTVRLLIMEAARGLTVPDVPITSGFIPEASATMPLSTESLLGLHNQETSLVAESLATYATNEATGTTQEGVTAQ